MSFNSFPNPNNTRTPTPVDITVKKETREDKRKCQNLSVKEKLSILKRIDEEGCSVTTIALEYGLSDTTLRRWRRRRRELENFEKGCNTSMKNKRMKTLTNSILNQALYVWFCQTKGTTPITGPILKAKALDLNSQLGENGSEKFTASDGWLSNWKSRCGIRLPTGVSKDKLSSGGGSSVEDFKIKFAELELGHENLTRSQIFSCDVAALNCKLMPDKSICIKGEEIGRMAVVFPQNNERINVMVCSNADGTLKLPLLVIGRSANPMSLKNIRKEFLPVYYTSGRNLSLDSTIFATWFTEQFVPQVSQFLLDRCQPMKAVLLLEHSSSHLSSGSLSAGQIKAIFLPPNVTSAIQPMDQKILENLRIRYKLKLLKSVLSAQDDGVDINSHLKTVTIRDVIYWISAAWSEVSADTIHKSCKELLTETVEIKTEDPLMERDESFDNILNILRRISGYHDASETDVRNWITNDGHETFEELTDAQIIQKVVSETANNHQDNDPENENSIEEPAVTPTEALQGIECAIKYFERRGNVSLTDMAVFLKAKDKVLTEKINVF